MHITLLLCLEGVRQDEELGERDRVYLAEGKVLKQVRNNLHLSPLKRILIVDRPKFVYLLLLSRKRETVLKPTCTPWEYVLHLQQFFNLCISRLISSSAETGCT